MIFDTPAAMKGLKVEMDKEVGWEPKETIILRAIGNPPKSWDEIREFRNPIKSCPSQDLRK